MSSGARRGASEENILAMLERDAARRRMAGSPRFAIYAIAGSVVLSLVGALAWLLHENNSANEVMRLPEQPGVSVAVVPDKPGAAPLLATAEPGLPSVAATIVDNPEPPLHKVADVTPASNKAAESEPPVRAITQAAAPVPKTVTPQPSVTTAHDGVPPLVMLKPAEAARARAGAPPQAPTAKAAASESARTTPVKQAASATELPASVGLAASTPAVADKRVTAGPGDEAEVARGPATQKGAAVAHAPAAAREAAAHGSASVRTAKAATKKDSARDDGRRLATRQRVPQSEPAAHARAADKARPAGRTRTEALASAQAKKPAASEKKKNDAQVDRDVALISAIIMHADGHAPHRPADASASADKNGAQQH
jgi:hypothetical protein